MNLDELKKRVLEQSISEKEELRIEIEQALSYAESSYKDFKCLESKKMCLGIVELFEKTPYSYYTGNANDDLRPLKLVVDCFFFFRKYGDCASWCEKYLVKEQQLKDTDIFDCLSVLSKYAYCLRKMGMSLNSDADNKIKEIVKSVVGEERLRTFLASIHILKMAAWSRDEYFTVFHLS
jgi:hypothetical protein